MSDEDSISFITPAWLLIYYHIIGIISVSISSLGVYLILFQSMKIGNFKYFLLWFELSCAITDINMTFFLQPVTLLPMWALYSVGYAWKLFRIPIRETTLFLVLWVGQQFAALVACFLVKHRSISQLGNNSFTLPNWLLNILLVAFQFVVCAFVAFFHKTQFDQRTAMEIVSSNYPELTANFESLECFQLFAENKSYPIFLTFCVVAGVLVVLAVGLTTCHMIHILNGNRRKISGANFFRQKNAVNSLVAQFLTSSIALIPPVVCFVVVLLDTSYSQEISYLMCAVFSTHATINCFVMIGTSPPYKKVFSRRAKTSTIASPAVFQRVQSVS